MVSRTSQGSIKSKKSTNRTKKLFLLVILTLFCSLFLISIEINQVSAMNVWGPKVYVDYDIGAPNENFKVGLNITNSEKPVDKVLLYYSVIGFSKRETC